MPRPPVLALAVLALVPLSVGVPAIAGAQTAAIAGADEARGRPMVLVVDPGRARVSSDRMLRVIGAATGRDVVRITDARAADSVGTLTIAYEGSGGWLVRFDSRGRTAVAHERIRPGALDASISAAVLRVIGDLEGPSSGAPSRAGTSSPVASTSAEGSAYGILVDEILDPFATLPPPAPREVAIYSEVLDPFAPTTAVRVGWSEVIDPWDR